MLVDIIIALFLVTSWMKRDAREHARRYWPYALATVALGSIGPLLYLALRRRPARPGAPAVVPMTIFPAPVTSLPEADLPVPGAIAWLSQGERHQVLFMQFTLDVDVAPHAHGAQWGIVVEGEMELVVGGSSRVLRKGDRYFIPAGVVHSAGIKGGYADVTFFADGTRYLAKPQRERR